MLTVDFTRLGLQPGETLLDMGAGAGRHAFESYRRGANVVAADLSLADLKDVQGMFAAMGESSPAGEGSASDEPAPRPEASLASRGPTISTVNADATCLPFDDDSIDRIIASEVLEHVPDDAAALAELTRVLRTGGVLAATVPAQLPERVCWALSDQYHAPFVEGGHVRIYSEATLRRRLRDAGLRPGGAHRAHALHSPYWWIKCAVGPANDDNALVQAYHRLLVWDITQAPKLTRWTERALNPLLGKSLVVYATKPLAPPAAAAVAGP